MTVVKGRKLNTLHVSCRSSCFWFEKAVELCWSCFAVDLVCFDCNTAFVVMFFHFEIDSTSLFRNSFADPLDKAR